MDERIRQIVHSQPIPMRLATAIYLAPDLGVNTSPSRYENAKRYGLGSLDPDDMPPIMHRTLVLICHGYSNEEIAERTHYAVGTVRDRSMALLTAFHARNRAHLSALAVSQGYVEMQFAA